MAVVLLALASSCAEASPQALKSAASARATRRAYDGAPPVIPHEAFEASCDSCHEARGVHVEGVGFAPPSPHAKTLGLSDLARCEQCHVHSLTDELFDDSDFAGLQQDLRRGRRLHAEAPPVMPHSAFMRENCRACHSGEAAREEIRTDHPDRERCRQCHVERTTRAEFRRS